MLVTKLSIMRTGFWLGVTAHADARWRLLLVPRLENLKFVKRGERYLRNLKYAEDRRPFSSFSRKHLTNSFLQKDVEIVQVLVTGPTTTLKREAAAMKPSTFILGSLPAAKRH